MPEILQVIATLSFRVARSVPASSGQWPVWVDIVEKVPFSATRLLAAGSITAAHY
jgi:hypothetical protein